MCFRRRSICISLHSSLYLCPIPYPVVVLPVKPVPRPTSHVPHPSSASYIGTRLIYQYIPTTFYSAIESVAANFHKMPITMRAVAP